MSLLPSTYDDPLGARAAIVEIVVPVYNEEAGLEVSVRRLHGYLLDRFPLTWLVTIADNASTDRTWTIACRLADELAGVRAVHLDQMGRGRALRSAWSSSRAPVVAYMDVDLSTDLDALLPLVAPLVSGHSDVAIGTRLAPTARVVRGPQRELISRTYNFILRVALRSRFSDAQCGFKAARTEVARSLLPLVEDEGWFFDTELLVLAELNGLRIHEVPVDWVDDADSRVDLVGTAKTDLAGVGRMLRGMVTGKVWLPASMAPRKPDATGLATQLGRFASVGAVSTLVFAALVTVLAAPFGLLVADVIALAVCSVANTAANRRLTFSLYGRAGRTRHYSRSLVVAGLPLALTLAGLVALTVVGTTTLAVQVLVLTLASATAAMVRFVAMRHWVFEPPGPAEVTA